MARPDCPRCGSDLVVAALPDSPSEWVEELRGGNVRARPVAGRGVTWLCRTCGHRWDPLPDPDAVLADLGLELESHEDLPSIEETEAHPGAFLRRAREEPGHTLGDAARGTRIPERHPQAHESGASLEEFPARPYARFSLREYAEFLQLQPERCSRSSSRANRRSRLALQPLPDTPDRRRLIAGAMAVVAVAALVVIALFQPRSAPDVEPPEASGATVRVHDPGRVMPPPSTPERRGVRAVLHVRQPCWVHVLADGEVVASITLVPGEAVVYRADRDLQLTLGNAGGVKLRVNDEQVRTGSIGEVVVLDLSWQRGEVLIERG